MVAKIRVAMTACSTVHCLYFKHGSTSATKFGISQDISNMQQKSLWPCSFDDIRYVGGDNLIPVDVSIEISELKRRIRLQSEKEVYYEGKLRGQQEIALLFF
jgi:hypothetical protein